VTAVSLSQLLYIAALCYVALVFVRPSEVLAGWGEARLVLGASVLAAPLLVVAWWRRSALPIELPHDRWLLGFWLAIGVSNVATGWLAGAALGVAQFAPVVFLYVLLRTAVTTPEQFRAVIVALIAAMLFHAAGAILQHHTGVGWGGITPYIEQTARRSRSVGIFNDPNDLALGFLMVLPFLMAGVVGRGLTLPQRVGAAAAAIPILVAFFYANSRGAMLGLAASVCVYCWRRFGPAVGTPIAVVALVTLMTVAPSRLGMLLNAREASAQGRIQAWAAGIEMVTARPVTGVGWNRYTLYHERPAHNSYLHAFAELGLLGGVCFVGVAYAFFWGLSPAWPTTEPAVKSLTNIEHALTSAGVGFFVDAFFLSKQYSIMTFTLVALGAVYVSIAQRARRGPGTTFGRRQCALVAAVALLILVAIWGGVRLLQAGRG
jgi:putative inorganic carbon (HCO3(-)) transporter